MLGKIQVVAINRAHDGLSPGHVLHLVTKGERIVDNTDPVARPSSCPANAMAQPWCFARLTVSLTYCCWRLKTAYA